MGVVEEPIKPLPPIPSCAIWPQNRDNHKAEVLRKCFDSFSPCA